MKTLVGPYLPKWLTWLVASGYKNSSWQKQTAFMICFKAFPLSAQRGYSRLTGEKGERVFVTKVVKFIWPCAAMSTWYSLQLPEPLPERQFSLRELAHSEASRPFCLRATSQNYIWNLIVCVFCTGRHLPLARTLLEVMLSHQCNRHIHMSETLSLKAWGGGIQWEFPALGACCFYRARHDSQGVFEFEGVCHHWCSWMQQWWQQVFREGMVKSWGLLFCFQVPLPVSLPDTFFFSKMKGDGGRENLRDGGIVAKWVERLLQVHPLLLRQEKMEHLTLPSMTRGQCTLAFWWCRFIIFYYLVEQHSGWDNNGGCILRLERQVVKDSTFIVFLPCSHKAGVFASRNKRVESGEE